MADKTGYYIPNATEAGIDVEQAAPDRIDFNTLGNQRYGVIEGCALNYADPIGVGSGVNIVVVDGAPHSFNDTTVPKPIPGANDRFDLIVYDSTAGVVTVPGTQSNDPVFPTLSDTQTLLGAVWVPTGGSGDSSDLVDKRVMLTGALVSSVGDSDAMIQNTRGPGDVRFQVNGDGRMTWRDVSLYRASAGKLATDKTLRAQNLEITNNASVVKDLVVQGLLSGANFTFGNGAPTSSQGSVGYLYIQQNSGGAVWFKTANGWTKILGDIGGADPVSGTPPATVISSVLPIGHAFLAGWLPMTGLEYSKDTIGRLYDLRGIAPFSDWWNAGPETMTIPDMTDRTVFGGTNGELAGSNLASIAQANLPAHKHFSDTNTESAGGHQHSSSITGGSHTHTMSSGGTHSHDINDPSHTHHGSNFFGADLIGVVWGGQNKIDGPFNDASHTYSVEAVTAVLDAVTGVTVKSTGSAHTHNLSTDSHSHDATINPAGGHVHGLPTESSVGTNTPLDTTPAHLKATFYIKT